MSDAAIGLRLVSERVNSTQDSDVALLSRVRQGDAAAMQSLVRRFGPRLNRLIGRLTAWSPDREDILQEVFLTAWQQAGTYRGEGPLENWLRRLAVNRCLNHRRARDAFARMLDRFVRRNKSAGSNAQPRVDHGTEVRDALAQLRREDRTVLVLYYLEELPGNEVADVLGIRAETLHVRLHRARQRLKQILSHGEQRDE